jgi:hypothetical protein
MLMAGLLVADAAVLRNHRRVPPSPDPDCVGREWSTIVVMQTVSGEMDRVRLILERYESKLQSLPVEILEVEDIDEYEDIYSLIATSSYMFGKMLLEEKYSIGKKTLEFVRLIKPIAGHRIHKDDVRWI